MRAFLGRNVSAIKSRSDKATSIGKEIADAHDLLVLRSRNIILNRIRGEKTVWRRRCPFRDPRQNRIVLQRKPDEVIRNLLNPGVLLRSYPSKIVAR